MEKPIAVVLTIIVGLFAAATILALFSTQIGDATQATDGQTQRGCDFQEQYAEDSSQYSDKCIGRADESVQDQEIFFRANVPVID